MKELKRLYNYLKKNENKKILFLTTSNRWEGEKELPKSSIIAEEIRKKINNCNIKKKSLHQAGKITKLEKLKAFLKYHYILIYYNCL